MEIFTLDLWEKDEYKYNTFTDFIPTITCYIQPTKKLKPSILVVAGGGYNCTSPAEAEVVALKFLEKGYNAFLLTYSVKGSSKIEPVKLQALKDIAKAMVIINENAKKWSIDTNKINTIGFSAGGHLCASLSVHHNAPFLEEIKKGYNICPNAQILSYPVISTTEEFSHEGSKNCLLGLNPTDEELNFMSVEKHISKDTPKTFLWHCMDDLSVPYQNSIAFSDELAKNNIPFEMHIFPYGAHGISTCDKSWEIASHDLNSPNLQLNKKLFEREVIERDGLFVSKEGIDLTDIKTYDEYCDKLSGSKNYDKVDTMEYKHISKWVDLAIEWLEIVSK